MSILRPNEHNRSIHDINLGSLKEKGITNLIVDLDETLRKRNDDHIPESSVEWINNAKRSGFNICISSNSFFPWKFKKIREKFNIPCSAFTLKPLPFAFWRSMEVLNSNISNTAMIGDQLFTDIFGANILGIHTIMVDPLTKNEPGFHRRIMRSLERLFHRPNQRS